MESALKYAPLASASCAIFMVLWNVVPLLWSKMTTGKIEAESTTTPWWKRQITIMLALMVLTWLPIVVPWIYGGPTTRSQNGHQVLCWDGPCAPTHKNLGPEYLKEIGLGSGPGQPLVLQAAPVVTSERLRIAVDYSEYRNGWMPKARALIGEIKEPIKGKIERMSLIAQATKENAGQNTLWWGDPAQNNAVTTPVYSSNIPAILVRARLVVIGPSGEQHHYFMLVRDAANTGTYVGILPEHDSGDWIESWENE